MTEYYQKVLDLFKQYDLDKTYFNENGLEDEEYVGVSEENGDITLEILYDHYESIGFYVCIEHFNGDMEFTFKSDYEDDNFSKFISSEEEFKDCFRKIRRAEAFYQLQLQENEKFVGCELIEKIISLAKE